MLLSAIFLFVSGNFKTGEKIFWPYFGYSKYETAYILLKTNYRKITKNVRLKYYQLYSFSIFILGKTTINVNFYLISIPSFEFSIMNFYSSFIFSVLVWGIMNWTSIKFRDPPARLWIMYNHIVMITCSARVEKKKMGGENRLKVQWE